MHWTEWFARWLPIAALGVTLAGLLDPLDGFAVVLIGGVLTVMAALQERSTHLRLAVGSLLLAALGCGAMVVMSSMGGVGGNTGRSIWWLVILTPYPIGVIGSLLASALILRGRSRARR